MAMKCELCSMESTHIWTDQDGLVHHYCEHHVPKGSTKIGDIKKVSLFKVYRPLFVVLLFILAYMLIRVSVRPNNGLDILLNDFMAGFFLVFGILELYTYRSFQVVLKKYDPIAKRFDVYAKAYPIIFIVFGALLHTNNAILPISFATIVMLGSQTYGIVNVLKRNEKIECACIGTAFSLPLSWVTVGENLLMIFMSIIMIIMKLA